MKVLIIGCGKVGSVLTYLLSKEKEVKNIICLNKYFVENLKHQKVKQHLMDLKEKEKLCEYLIKEKPNIVINTATPHFNLSIMECCAKAEVNYMDTASFWDLDPNPNAKVPYKMEQLDHHPEFQRKGILGLIEAGVAPGLDNIFAVEAASELDEVDYIKIRMVEDTGSKEIFFSWNKEWLLDELESKPIVYENGKFKFVENFGAEEEYDFPAPIGKRKTYYFCQDEVGSIPSYIKTKKLDVKIHDNNIEVSKVIVALGLTSQKEIEVDGIKIKPINFLSKILPDSKPGEEKRFPKSIFAFAVEAIGKKNKKKRAVKYSVIFPNQEVIGKMNIGANFISFPTALSVKLFAMILKDIKETGVHSPEILNKELRKKIISELPKYKVKVHKKVYTPKN